MLTSDNDELLLRTLCEKPGLGKLVRNANLESTRGDIENILDAIKGSTGLQDGLKRLVEDALDEEFDEPDVGPAVFLALLPNIDKLQLTMYTKDEIIVTLFRSLVSLVTSLPQTDNNNNDKLLVTDHFSQLKKLDISHWDSQDAVNIWHYQELFGLPSLQSFSGQAIHWCVPSPAQVTSIPIQYSNITKISSSWSLIEHHGLTKLLSICPQLRALDVEWGDTSVGDDGGLYFRLSVKLSAHTGPDLRF
ncbi:hypothetical protein BX600DRAFT_496230 [Xylariales sp. PMI_506]|nr:hypothetical protein BX600DRAFT_496230 [Xylariales sp. PMI_506]